MVSTLPTLFSKQSWPKNTPAKNPGNALPLTFCMGNYFICNSALFPFPLIFFKKEEWLTATLTWLTPHWFSCTTIAHWRRTTISTSGWSHTDISIVAYNSIVCILRNCVRNLGCVFPRNLSVVHDPNPLYISLCCHVLWLECRLPCCRTTRTLECEFSPNPW